ncbi:MAG: BatD family protein [Gemmatimonadaceae bacterium]|nr:BatD family protein [Gemmatimonadaceae bacterium]
MAYDLPVANDALPSREVDGARYRPFIFARALFPLRAGTLTIPAARLTYTLGAGGTVFGKQERQSSSTTPRTVVVREIPAAGRPASFTGAIGVYSATAVVERSAGRVGDAVQLTVRVTGVGNVKLLPAPTLMIPNVTISSAGEAIAVDSTDLLIRGTKTFRYLLTPQRDGDLALGELRYGYFNPVRGVYEETTAPLGALRVAPGTSVIGRTQTTRRIQCCASAAGVECAGGGRRDRDVVVSPARARTRTPMAGAGDAPTLAAAAAARTSRASQARARRADRCGSVAGYAAPTAHRAAGAAGAAAQ